MSKFREIAAAVSISIKSIKNRASMSLATVIGIALVILVLVGFLSMSHGFREMLSRTGSPDVLIVTSKGSNSEADSVITGDDARIVSGLLESSAKGGAVPRFSLEAYTVVPARKRDDGGALNLPLRGVGENALALRENFRLASGRMFEPGSQEIIIGKALSAQAEGFDLGSTVSFGPAKWKIVGIFDTGGSALESEIWGDLDVIRSFYRLDNTYQSIRIRENVGARQDAIERAITDTRQLNLQVVSEQEFFSTQSRGISRMIEVLGWPLAMLMAVGALAGGLNTMHSSVAARASEIGTLRIIGFGQLSTFAGVMAEAMTLALVGAVLGLLSSYLLFNGMTASTVSSSLTSISFTLALSIPIALSALVLGLSVGLIGGAIAAWRAARQPILETLSQ